ncbi:MAG: hypothetical protein RR824_07140 [Clostridia bacterium]
MVGYDPEEAKRFILSKLEKKPFAKIASALPQLLGDLIEYDLHFMRLTGVIDENGEQGENEYDDDEAFEYLYDAYLSDHPNEDDEEMLVAALLDRYMELQYEFLCAKGLAQS